jgi:transposase
MPRGLLTMSTQEVERLTVIKQVAAKQLKQGEAMRLLKLSKRQVIRLVKGYRREGTAGLISKQRGQCSNRKYTEEKKETIKEIVEKIYRDFGPKFAAEKLEEKHKIKVSKETLRKWMIDWGLWKARRHKRAQIHQSRERRACFGELIQIDGSPHDWFEGRGPKCCLLVFIDDATSQLVGLRFEATETTAGYFRLARQYMERDGVPLAFYSDKYGVFRVNLPEAQGDCETQFGRGCRALGIELICADSPQAKGRVERANNTLQDRLVKEMRLAGINDMEAGNAFVPTFMKSHNDRFSVIPRSEINAHRKALPEKEALDLIFSFQDERKLSKNLELSYKNRIYQIQTATTGYRLRGAKVTVCEDSTGKVTLMYKDKILVYRCHQKASRLAPIVTAKQLGSLMDDVIKVDGRSHNHGVTPKISHPWRQYKQTAIRAEMTQKRSAW